MEEMNQGIIEGLVKDKVLNVLINALNSESRHWRVNQSIIEDII